MKRYFIPLLAGTCCLGVSLASDNPGLASAQKALDDGLPTLAIYRLEQAAATLTSDADKFDALRLRVRALNDARRYADTVAILEAKPKGADTLSLALGQAYAGLGQTEKALPLYQALAPTEMGDVRFAMEYAALLQDMGRLDEADGVLTQFLAGDKSETPDILLNLISLRLAQGNPRGAWEILSKLKEPAPDQAMLRDYLAAQTLLALDRVTEAGEYLAKLENPPPTLAGKVLLVRAEYLRKTNDLAAAEKAVEKFVDDNPRQPDLALVLAELDAIYGQQGAASGTELRRWSQDTAEVPRQALALYYLAKNEARNSKVERSQQLLEDFLQKFPDHPLVPEARFGLASSYLNSKQPERALTVLQGTVPGGKIGFLRGMALASMEKYPDAASSFLLAADDPVLKKPALFNAAVCNALAGVSEGDNQAFQEISKSDPDGTQTRKLRLTQALYLARNQNPEAEQLLKSLIQGDDDVAHRAQFALAEWNYSKDDLASAGDVLRKISTADPAARERADYLAIFLADTGSDESAGQVSALAEAFLKNYPDSAFEADVRLKLGEILFRKGDYLGARGQFEAILENSSSSPLADKAAFLSAQAMSRSMDPVAMGEAIETYDTVVKSGGPLALRARLAQATLFNALNRHAEAIGVLDGLLAANPDPELRAMALTEKGLTYFVQGPESPENYKQAIATWQILASDPDASITWHNQALTRMGAAYEKLGDTGAALNCYYNVFSAGQKGEPEYFWFYKAGFAAGDYLASQKLWNEAIAVYEKLGAIDGPRAEEARNRVNKLRLENFLWEN